MKNLYLDIETTGFSAENDDILIVGMLCDNDFIQLVKGMGLSKHSIDEFILEHEPEYIVTYNGIKFDIPMLERNKAIRCESFSSLKQKDLMVLCHNNNIKGGLKKAEKHFGIVREEEPINYFQQKALWKKWEKGNDYNSLIRFLKYNEDDVRNLQFLEQKLQESQDKKEASYNSFKKAFLEKQKKK